MALPTHVRLSRYSRLFPLISPSRSISATGASEYRLNDRVVTYAAYNAALVSHNILVKAKNFLVFQGDVEAVASQSPRELTRLIEQISGSLELAPDYERAKEAQERATENATFNFTKRRGITGEIRQYKEQKSEAERFEGLCQEKVSGSSITFTTVAYMRFLGRSHPTENSIQVVPYRRSSWSQRTRHSEEITRPCRVAGRAART